jgi:MFS transporter, DHA1 family, multidrug resistance protein
MSGYWFVANQMYLSVPIHINRLTGDVALIGAAFAVQAVLAMALQVPLVRLVCRLVSPLTTISLGILLMGIGLGAVPMATGGYGILACVIVFGIGRLLVEPVRDAVTADLAAPGSSAAYFGFGYLSLAFGGSLGNWIGGRLMDLAVEPGLGSAPWIVFAAVGIGSATGMAVLNRTPTRGRREPINPVG